MDVNITGDAELTNSTILNILANSAQQRRFLNDSINSTITTQSSSKSTCVLEKKALITAALELNKKTDEKMQELQQLLMERLQECKIKLCQIAHTKKYCLKKNSNFGCPSYLRPYFKDRFNMPPPDNEDTIHFRTLDTVDPINFNTVWTEKDKLNLINIMHKVSVDIRMKQLHYDLGKTQQKILSATDSEKEDLNTLLDNLEGEMCNINNKPLKDIALPINEDYNWKRVADMLKRHTPQECKSLWQLYLHPSINQGIWKKSEHVSLMIIAKKHKFTNWDVIAKELNTGRTGYQCFVHYRAFISKQHKERKWSQEEEEHLMKLIDYYKEDRYIPWGKVTNCMKGRVRVHVYHKYLRMIEGKRKGRFVPEEDTVLLKCIDNFGTNYKKVKEHLPERSLSQIRGRNKILNKYISTVWTLEEDRKLLLLLARQDSKDFSSLTPLFPGKDRVQLRCRYSTLVKWMKKYPRVDISEAPRRGARRLSHGHIRNAHPDLSLKKAVEKLNTETDSKSFKKKSKISKNSNESDIEAAIIATIYNLDMEGKEDKNDNKMKLKFEKNLRNMLIYLNAKFDKEIFKASYYNDQYPTLQNDFTLKKNCYSRTNETSVCNIWYGNPLLNAQYVLPPHYSTLIGCRKLMSYCSDDQNYDAIDIELCLQRNTILQEQYSILLQRVKILFLWPLILSDWSPKDVPNIRIHGQVGNNSIKNLHKK